MSFYNSATDEEFEGEDEDDYLRSMKQDDSYELSYDYEYIANRFGDGDDDVELEVAKLDVSVSWDDSSTPGYVVSYRLHSPTTLPNNWTGDADEIFSDLRSDIVLDLADHDVGPGLLKDWPI